MLKLKQTLTTLCFLAWVSLAVAQSYGTDLTTLESFIKKKNLQPSPIASFSELTDISDFHTFFDVDGNLVKETIYHANGDFLVHTEYTYDENGKKLDLLSYNADGDLQSQNKFSYIYDEEGHLIETNSLPTMQSNYLYDTDGNLTQENLRLIGSKDSIIQYKYIYNKKGNLVEQSYIDSITENKNTYRHNNQGHLIQEIFYYNDYFDSLRTYQNDAYGNMIEVYSLQNDLKVKAECTYEYDKYLNWTKQACLSFTAQGKGQYLPNGRELVRTRIIKYYE